jgi:hypothetical protein
MAKSKSQQQNLEEFLQEATDNVRHDRAITSALLTSLMKEMQKQGMALAVIEQTGLIASKYVETLQRSNEQLVKISSIIQKRETKSSGLSSFEKDEIFDLLGKGDIEDNG